MDDERRMRAEKLEKLAAMRAMESERGGGLAERQEAMHGALNLLGERIERLEAALQPVLRESEPTENLHATPRMPSSPLGEFMQGAAGHANDLARRLEDLTRRVDL